MAVKMTDYKKLPVYEQKEKILECLKENQVIVVQSPTGSGKTTQIPVILHEAGFSESGVIAVTQPRRIAALSVSEFIARQLGTTYPGLVGYKMRFEDFTDATTKIKIMTHSKKRKSHAEGVLQISKKFAFGVWGNTNKRGKGKT